MFFIFHYFCRNNHNNRDYQTMEWILENIIELDTWLLLQVNGFNHEIADPFIKAFSGKGIWVPFYISIAATLWWLYGWRRALIFILAIGVAVGLSDFTCASIIRPLVQRLRPTHPDNAISELVHIVNGYRSGNYGFPSCHATNAVALALFTSLVIRRRAYVACISLWALAQCYSRLYLGVHYPGDLFAGALIGAVYSLICYRLVTRYVSTDDTNVKAKAAPAIAVCAATVIFLAVKSLLF